MEHLGSGIFHASKEEPSFSEERRTKQDDESSSYDEFFINKSSANSSFNFENIRFTPKVIEFSDAYEGKQFTEKFKIQNIGKNPVFIKIGEPNSFIFQLQKSHQHVKFLPSGSSISKALTYTHHNDYLVSKSQLPVHVNGCLVNLPIVVKKAEPEIEVRPQKLHFKIINLGASAKAMSLSIINTGGKRTKFEIDSGKNFDLVIRPLQGTVRPKQSVNVSVEIMGFSEGEFYQELWIKTSVAPIRVPVLVEVVRPRLEIVYPIGTDDFTLINFKPTFFGTQQIDSFVVKNLSVETTLFVILGEVNGELVSLKDARNHSDSFNMFGMAVEEGRLEPFENRVFNIWFRPKRKDEKTGWHHEKVGGGQDSHIVFLRIKTVRCIELKNSVKIGTESESQHIERKVEEKVTYTGDSSNTEQRAAYGHIPTEAHFMNKTSDLPNARAHLPEVKTWRLCLHGPAVFPDILIQPSSFEFSDLILGQSENKVLRITNNCVIPVRCRLRKLPNLKTQPSNVWLSSGKAVEFLLTLKPSFAGDVKTNLCVEILAKSDRMDSPKKTFIKVATYFVRVSFSSRGLPPPPQPKIGLGITPLVKDDVGFGKELVTYKNAFQFPYAAMLGLKQGFKPAWMSREKDPEKNVDNAMIALPNDRPRDFHTWPKDQVCRAIFTGFFRYSPPPDLFYTLSPEEQAEKKRRRDVWQEFTAESAKRRKQTCPEKAEDWDCDRIPDQHKPKLKKYASGASAIPQGRQSQPKLSLMPLTPKFLNEIRVAPKLIDFKMVAAGSKTETIITIENKNPFPISVKFIPGNSNVWLMGKNTRSIQANETKRIQVFLRTKEFGRFFGFLNYIINWAHEFKIPISAMSFSKTLILPSKHIEFGLYHIKHAFQYKTSFFWVENYLQSPIKYKWVISEDSIFRTDIIAGEIPPQAKLLVEIYYTMHPHKSFFTDFTFTSESGISEGVKISHPHKKISVNFLRSSLNMLDIPLNLPTEARPVILNECYHDICFTVLCSNPMPGVTIKPKDGVIKARSFFPLRVVVQIPVIMKFSFEVLLSVHFCDRISVKIEGNVVCPMIKMRPSDLNFRKISEGSFDSIGFCLENEGTTPAEVNLNFASYSEFKVEGPSLIHLPENSVQKVVLRFEPKSIARFMFYLPIIINGILGPPQIQNKETEFLSFYLKFEQDFRDFGEVFNNPKLRLPCITVFATVTHKLLDISPMNVTFGGSPNDEKALDEIKITNVSNEELTFCIRTDSLGEFNESPFNLIPVFPNSVEYRLRSMKARLSPGEKLLLKATFDPKMFEEYSVEVPVFVRGYNDGFVYNNICLSGKVKQPKIHPKSSEVYFAPVPLGVTCDLTLKFTALNYEFPPSISLVFVDPVAGTCESSGNELVATWVEDTVAKENRTFFKFQLQISFQSSVPVALRKYILLLDSSGRVATVLVSAIADNSTTTTHSFLSTRRTKYKLVGQSEASGTRENQLMKSLRSWQIERDRDGRRSSGEELVQQNTNTSSSSSKDSSGMKRSSESKRSSTSKLSTELRISETVLLRREKGPSLYVQSTKSTSRINQLNLGKLIEIKSASENLISLNSKTEDAVVISSSSAFERPSKGISSNSHRPEFPPDDLTYPNFPSEKNVHWEYFQKTVEYLERWIYEVVMRCDQYFRIPWSFQWLSNSKKGRGKSSEKKNRTQKDVLDYLAAILPDSKTLPSRPVLNNNRSEVERALNLRSFFSSILNLLAEEGCLLPHIRPEYLMEYEEYVIYLKSIENVELVLWNEKVQETKTSLKSEEGSQTHVQVNLKKKSKVKSSFKNLTSDDFSNNFWSDSFTDANLNANASSETREGLQEKFPLPGKESSDYLSLNHQFEHKMEDLEKKAFNSRSTQAWLDIVIQTFRVFILSQIQKKNTINDIKVVENNEKKTVEILGARSVRNFISRLGKKDVGSFDFDTLTSNIYTTEEQLLLAWLDHFLQVQADFLWEGQNKCYIARKVLKNFDEDLSDSVALISLTASHCPYIVHDYFQDVYVKPDTPNKMQHNAGRLVQAWRTLQIGLTVETADITKPNPLFMVMLLTHLYDVLPSLYPQTLIRFSAPLNSESSKKIQLKNESRQHLIYDYKFFGESKALFRLSEKSLIEIKSTNARTIVIIFSSKHIRKISGTLFLCGCTESPYFGKHMAFNLEGEPSELFEFEKISFSAPLCQVICSEIKVKSPYPETTTYDIWYTTRKPEYVGQPDSYFKPWSKICHTKVSRRLFLSKSEVKIYSGGPPPSLGITVACLTPKKRFFWLLFRSEIGAFIVRIEINSRLSEIFPELTGFYMEAWATSTCTCPEMASPKLTNRSCPCLTELKIPRRNEPLWNALRKMFLRTLHNNEKFFWDQYFEKDIGIYLILWPLSPKEEEEVVAEFVDVLLTKVTYNLDVDSPYSQYIVMPKTIEIADVRQHSDIAVPIHISNSAPPELNFVLRMMSENRKEIRHYNVYLKQPPPEKRKILVSETTGAPESSALIS